jgi:serine/threonine protein kinase/tetratricopeptide (TPR) repeat protein
MIPGQKVGSYEIVSLLGAGAMGEVYRAHDLKLGRDVAIKVLPDSVAGDPERLRQLTREARLLAALNHPNIAAIYSLEEFQGSRGLILELVDGPTLADRLATGPLPLDEALRAAACLAEALVAAHDKGILHRDLKPANIKFAREGMVKILDFGLAKVAPNNAGADELQSTQMTIDTTKVGWIKGTPSYMSPEQARGKSVNKYSDIWAFGCVLYEMLTGQQAFGGHTFSDVVAVILMREPQWSALPKTVPLKIRRLLERCLDKNPATRLTSLSEALIDIRGALTQLDSTKAMPPVADMPVKPLTPWRKTTTRLIVLVGFAVLTLSVAVSWLFENRLKPGSRGEIPMIAVLPLANLSGDPSNDYIGVGVAETLTTDLAAVSGITVVSRSMPEVPKGSKDLVRLAHDLGVGFLLDGGVQENDRRLKVTVRLIRADGSVAWGNSFEGTSAELFMIESSLANSLIGALQLQLTQTERIKLGKQPTSDVAAFADYAKGRTLLERVDVPGNLDQAIQLFSAALERDRNFSLAYAGLGEAYWARYQQTKDPDWTIKARQSTLEALRLDPNQPAVRRSLAIIYRGNGDTDTAIEELHRAIELRDSDDLHQMLGQILADKERINDAIVEFDKAIALRPNFWGNYDTKGLALYRAGRFAEAAIAFERVTKLQPDIAGGFQRLGTAYHAAGDTAKALVNYNRALKLAPTPKAYANLGFFYYSQHQFAEAADAYLKALALDPTSHASHRNLGDVYQRLGRTQDARKEYTTAVEITDRMLQVNAKDALTLSQRGLYEAKLGRRDAADTDAAAAVALAPANPQVIYNQAGVYALAGKREAALKALKDALAHGASESVAREDDDLQSIRTQGEFK